MRAFFLASLIFTAFSCYCQEKYLVIASSNGTTVDRQARMPGDYVSATEHFIEVPDGGYIILLSMNGIARKITSSVSINKLQFVEATGAVLHGIPDIELTAILGLSSKIYGDTLTLKWKHKSWHEKYNIELKDEFDDQLYSTTLDINFYRTSIKQFLEKNKAVFIKIESLPKQPTAPGDYMIKRPSKQEVEQLMYDLSRIPGTDSIIYRLILFEQHGFEFDFLNELFLYSKQNQKFNSYFQNYVDRKIKLWNGSK